MSHNLLSLFNMFVTVVEDGSFIFRSDCVRHPKRSRLNCSVHSNTTCS